MGPPCTSLPTIDVDRLHARMHHVLGEELLSVFEGDPQRLLEDGSGLEHLRAAIAGTGFSPERAVAAVRYELGLALPPAVERNAVDATSQARRLGELAGSLAMRDHEPWRPVVRALCRLVAGDVGPLLVQRGRHPLVAAFLDGCWHRVRREGGERSREALLQKTVRELRAVAMERELGLMLIRQCALDTSQLLALARLEPEERVAVGGRLAKLRRPVDRRLLDRIIREQRGLPEGSGKPGAPASDAAVERALRGARAGVRLVKDSLASIGLRVAVLVVPWGAGPLPRPAAAGLCRALAAHPACPMRGVPPNGDTDLHWPQLGLPVSCPHPCSGLADLEARRWLCRMYHVLEAFLPRLPPSFGRIFLWQG